MASLGCFFLASRIKVSIDRFTVERKRVLLRGVPRLRWRNRSIRPGGVRMRREVRVQSPTALINAGCTWALNFKLDRPRGSSGSPPPSLRHLQRWRPLIVAKIEFDSYSWGGRCMRTFVGSSHAGLRGARRRNENRGVQPMGYGCNPWAVKFSSIIVLKSIITSTKLAIQRTPGELCFN